jgi:hypothetical protein
MEGTRRRSVLVNLSAQKKRDGRVREPEGRRLSLMRGVMMDEVDFFRLRDSGTYYVRGR